MNDKQSKLAILPLSRIKMIMKSSPEVGNISPDSCFLVTKATEGFIAFLVRQALKASDNKTRVDYSDLAKIVSTIDTLDFLKDIIPPKIRGDKYLEILKKIEEHEQRIALEDQEL
ncbi:chromatin accessibility complex protein 1 [Trichonephila inaurata madagascariensis]|uniref:Chromatin accessibility complex protein 1 n=2 Tax=Trichonephila TaxID=2585208 RepID=A0A8X6YDY3_9ARAC|nr:chromatin accessibility complex protein 1 [Trichonephila inaurata madagascariensis]